MITIKTASAVRPYAWFRTMFQSTKFAVLRLIVTFFVTLDFGKYPDHSGLRVTTGQGITATGGVPNAWCRRDCSSIWHDSRIKDRPRNRRLQQE